MIKWILNKIVGSKNQREVRKLKPVVRRILDLEKSWAEKDRDFLLGKTREWQAHLHRFTPMDLPTRGVVLASSPEQLQGPPSARQAPRPAHCVSSHAARDRLSFVHCWNILKTL